MGVQWQHCHVVKTHSSCTPTRETKMQDVAPNRRAWVPPCGLIRRLQIQKHQYLYPFSRKFKHAIFHARFVYARSQLETILKYHQQDTNADSGKFYATSKCGQCCDPFRRAWPEPRRHQRSHFPFEARSANNIMGVIHELVGPF